MVDYEYSEMMLRACKGMQRLQRVSRRGIEEFSERDLQLRNTRRAAASLWHVLRTLILCFWDSCTQVKLEQLFSGDAIIWQKAV